MKKAILVDDDFLVRSYLKMLSSWQKAGYEVAADVRDGEEALALLKTMEVDLVVTDISMPLMDGIQLIREIRRFDQELYIIVLSCHDDFDYVKDAMREGADEYILKNTLDEDSLLELLYTTTEKIKEKREKQYPGRQMEKETGQDEQQDMNQKYLFFNQVLSGVQPGKEQELEAVRVRAGIRGKFQNSAVVVIGMKEGNEQTEEEAFQKEQDCRLFLRKLKTAVKFVENDFSQEVEVVYLGYGIFCCFIDLSGIHRSSVMQQILTSIASSCYRVCRQEEARYQVAVSNVCMGNQSVRQAYQQARAMLKLAFYEKEEILYYSPEKKVGNKLPETAKTLLRNVDKYFGKADRHKALGECQQVMESFYREHTDSRLVLQWLHSMEQMAELPEGYDYSKIDGIEEVKKRLENAVEALFENQSGEIPEHVSDPIRAAAMYVLQNYRSQIGLNEAAEAAGLNPTYLSYLFRQEMGVGFSGFLMERRLSCAKRLLSETGLKVHEIAEKSGFNDYHYFSKAFKKACKMSAAEYRKKNRVNQ